MSENYNRCQTKSANYLINNKSIRLIRRFKIKFNGDLYPFEQETDGSEAVVATDHCAVGVLHPTIVKVAPTLGQLPDKPTHTIPSAVAHRFRLLGIVGNPLLPYLYVAGVKNRIFIKLLQIFIVRFANGCNSYIVHNSALRGIVCDIKRLFTEFIA